MVGPNGEEWKRFCYADIMGVSLARRAGLKLALISGENSPLVDRYAQKMHISHVTKGCRDKAQALRDFSAATGIDLAEICFMGDDINDLPAMRIAGFSAAPANAATRCSGPGRFYRQKHRRQRRGSGTGRSAAGSQGIECAGSLYPALTFSRDLIRVCGKRDHETFRLCHALCRRSGCEACVSGGRRRRHASERSLGAESALTPVCNSHEQASAMCAEAMPRSPTIWVFAWSPLVPAATNAVTGVAGAWLDSTPTLFLSGQVKRPDRMFDAAGKPLGMRQLGIRKSTSVSIVKPDYQVRGDGAGARRHSLSPGKGRLSGD